MYNINKQSIDYIYNEAYENTVPGIPPSAVFLSFTNIILYLNYKQVHLYLNYSVKFIPA